MFYNLVFEEILWYDIVDKIEVGEISKDKGPGKMHPNNRQNRS